LWDTELDFDVLKKAVGIAYERNDCLGIRLFKEGRKVRQYFAQYEEPDIEHLDFRGKTLEEMEKKLYKIAGKRITYFKKPLSKAYLMHSYEGRQGIYFAVSHMVMDFWAVAAFFKDILAVYKALIEGTDMPKPLASFEELLKRELDYINTNTYRKDLEYWEKAYEKEEPLNSHINGPSVLGKYRLKKKNPDLRYAPYFSLLTKAKNIVMEIPKELVGKMESYCADNKLTMQSLVMLAFRSYLSKVNNNQKDICFNTVAARRGTLEEKNTGGCLLRFFMLRTIFEENDTIKKACETINEKQTAIYRHACIDSLEVMGIWRKLYNTSRLGEYAVASLSFQPVKIVPPPGMKLETKWYGNGATQQVIYTTIMDGDGTGSLKVYYEYRIHDVTLETVQKLHAYMMKFFEAATSRDEITIGELLRID
jgi:hypothetical protein